MPIISKVKACRPPMSRPQPAPDGKPSPQRGLGRVTRRRRMVITTYGRARGEAAETPVTECVDFKMERLAAFPPRSRPSRILLEVVPTTGEQDI